MKFLFGLICTLFSGCTEKQRFERKRKDFHDTYGL